MAGRTRTRKVLAVDIDLDETATHWVIYARPHLELEARGIRPLRAKKAKCVCSAAGASPVSDKHGERLPWVTAAGVCRYADCKGWTVLGVATYMTRLLRAYPKVPVKVTRDQLGLEVAA